MPRFGDKTQKPWSLQNETRLKRIRLLSHLLDAQFRIPGTTYRVGLDGLLGLIPGVGDAAGALLSAYILYRIFPAHFGERRTISESYLYSCSIM
jgi:hypothetical protein